MLWIVMVKWPKYAIEIINKTIMYIIVNNIILN